MWDFLRSYCTKTSLWDWDSNYGARRLWNCSEVGAIGPRLDEMSDASGLDWDIDRDRRSEDI